MSKKTGGALVLPHPAPRQTASLRAVAYPLVQEARRWPPPSLRLVWPVRLSVVVTWRRDPTSVCWPSFPPPVPPAGAPFPPRGPRGLNSPASAVSGRRRRPSKGSPPSAAQTVRAVFPHTAFTRLPGGREMEGVNEWTFCSPVGLSQSASLLGRSLLGLSHKELIRAIGLTHSRPAVSPTTFADRLPQPTRLPLSRSNGFHRPSGTIRSSDSSHDIAFHFAVRLIGRLTSVPAEDRARPPGVTCGSSVPCRLHTP